MKKVIAYFKKDVMLGVSVLAAVVSLFITPPSKALLRDIDWKTLATLFMLLSVLDGFKHENLFLPVIRLTRRIRTQLGLSFFLVFGVFFSSMFVTNDVSLIIFVPLTILLFRAGDRVMQVKNNYDILWREEGGTRSGMGMFNGDIGVIRSIEGDITTVDFDGKVVEKKVFKADAPARTAVKVGDCAVKEGTFLRLTADGNVADFYFARFKELPLPKADVKVAFDGLSVTLTTDKPAFFCWANVTGVKGEFNDNCVTVLPGRPVKLTFTPKQSGVTAELFKANFSLTHLRQTY